MNQLSFDHISKSNILDALKRIDIEGYPENRKSNSYDLVFDGKTYPPKYVLSLAGFFSDGHFISQSDFKGGENTAAFKFLYLKGFEISSKEETHGLLESRISKVIKDKYTIEFFTIDELDLLSKVAKTKYNSGDSVHVYQRKRLNEELYPKIEFWANEVQLRCFPEHGTVDVTKNAINQGQKFEYYLWAKIYPNKIFSDLKTIAYTVDISTDNDFTIKIDSVKPNGFEPEKRKKYLAYRGDWYESSIVKSIALDQILNNGWKNLIEISVSYINSLSPHFNQLANELNLQIGSHKNLSMLSIMNQPLNLIMYGPPGTGKTFKLSSEYFPKYTSSETSITAQKHFENVVKSCSWWKVIAIALIELGKSKVSEIREHKWIKEKERISKSSNITPTLWQQLQSHTVFECENVNVSKRSSTLIYNKTTNSDWEVIRENIQEQVPEIIELIESVNGFEPNPDKEIKRYVFTTFHQSYAYEDFIEGIKPAIGEKDEPDGELKYVIESGVFKTLCEEAELDPDNRYAIFIDEINRGNVSQVFGELITLIESDKRKGEKNELTAYLPYSKSPFSVPTNVDIIGTMNTADRSVEALDVALRRRFHFEAMMPKPELLSPERMIWDLWWKYEKYDWDNHEFVKAENALFEIIGESEDFENNKVSIWEKWDNQKNEDQINSLNGINWPGIKLNELLSVINERISFLKDEDHQIGHSYFMNVSSKEDLADTFNKNIIPLLQEHFYNDYSKIR